MDIEKTIKPPGCLPQTFSCYPFRFIAPLRSRNKFTQQTFQCVSERAATGSWQVSRSYLWRLICCTFSFALETTKTLMTLMSRVFPLCLNVFDCYECWFSVERLFYKKESNRSAVRYRCDPDAAVMMDGLKHRFTDVPTPLVVYFHVKASITLVCFLISNRSQYDLSILFPLSNVWKRRIRSTNRTRDLSTTNVIVIHSLLFRTNSKRRNRIN